MSSPNETYRQVIKADRTISGQMFCSHCQARRPSAGGIWKIVNNGKNRRWKCSDCVARAKARAAGDGE